VSITAMELLQNRRPASSRNGESEGTHFGKGEGKYNGEGAVHQGTGNQKAQKGEGGRWNGSLRGN
jgi:hypothetical protein